LLEVRHILVGQSGIVAALHIIRDLKWGTVLLYPIPYGIYYVTHHTGAVAGALTSVSSGIGAPLPAIVRTVVAM